MLTADDIQDLIETKVTPYLAKSLKSPDLREVMLALLEFSEVTATDLSDLLLRVGAAEDNIIDLQTTVTDHEGRIAALEASVAALQSALTMLTAQVSANTAAITTNTANIATLAARPIVLPFPFNGSANKTGAPPGYNSANWYSPELLIPTGYFATNAKLQVKAEATSGTAAFNFSVSELNAGSSTPTTSPIPASLTAYAAGAGIATLTSPTFTVTPGNSYIVSVVRTSGANGITVYAANLILTA